MVHENVLNCINLFIIISGVLHTENLNSFLLLPMKTFRSLPLIIMIIIASSCGRNENSGLSQVMTQDSKLREAVLPLDKGFSDYIEAFTSGQISSGALIEIRFTPEFAARIDKSRTGGLFTFKPAIRGKSEWTDDLTLVFRPSALLEAGTVYTGELNLSELGTVSERLKIFPIRFQTPRKEFSVVTGSLLCSASDPSVYRLEGEVILSDLMEDEKVESIVTATLGRKKMELSWDHTDQLLRKFTVRGIERTDIEQELILEWNGTRAGMKRKGSGKILVPRAGEFSIIDLLSGQGENPQVTLVFSDPPDAAADIEGLIHTDPYSDLSTSIEDNTITVVPLKSWSGTITLTVEEQIQNLQGQTLAGTFRRKLDFSPARPQLQLSGSGVILPSSQNLIFPFRAVNLNAVDLRIVRIFDNNLPYFLQDNDLTTDYNIRRFGRQIYAGRIDLPESGSSGRSSWGLYTIDLADYINVEPGVLYKVKLSMRKSYSALGHELTADELRYEDMLSEALSDNGNFWSDPDLYYEDPGDLVYYSWGFSWRERNDPSSQAYYSPDKSISRNILASNLGLTAKNGEDKELQVIVSDLITAMPVAEVELDVFDYQMQKIGSGLSSRDGLAAIRYEGTPYLLTAKKDKDRNYLKINDGNSLSLSAFDVSGTRPEKGIKAFIYGERDVWRPGDSIFLALFIKDLNGTLPPDHPVQFELFNPLDQRVDNQVVRPGGARLLTFTTKTAAEAHTGNYRAVFKIGGAVFTKSLRIETIKPNRLKLELSFPEGMPGADRESASGTLNVKWLNGSKAGSMDASVEYLLKPVKTVFAKFPGYEFDDPASGFMAESVNIFDGRTDENGKAIINFSPENDDNAPGMLNAVFTVRVQERGGDESITQSAFRYAPYPVFAGISIPALSEKNSILYTDSDNEVRIVTLDENGKPVNSEVEYTVYKLSYRWWWESDEENLAYYIRGDNQKLVHTGSLVTNRGEGSFSFRIGKEEWGRYLIRVSIPGGHSSGKLVLIDWPWDYGVKSNAEGATILSVSTDKEEYSPGDEVRISFPSPANARAYITLENSVKVLQQMQVATSEGTTELRFRAGPEMTPNVYAFVSVVQPHNQTVNDLPVRLYGVVPVIVTDKDTKLDPVISSADEIRSQRPFEIKVSEQDGKPMNYTLAVVDEGLLDITGFSTPDPREYFYAREALGVRTWDLYDYVLGAFGATLERVFAIGGDEMLIDRTAGKAQRFVPVVRFLGPCTLEAGKTNTHRLVLPQYTGSVKVMVIAGNEKAYGKAEKKVKVADPLMLLVTAPRVISPGEKAALPLTLFVNKENPGEITIRAESNELLSLSRETQTLKSLSTGEHDLELEFTAGAKTGSGVIKVTASASGESATYSIELEVREPNYPETRTEQKIISQGEKVNMNFSPFGTEGSNSASIEISALPYVNLDKRLSYLTSYPHGCSEQIVSAVFPQLWLKDFAMGDQELLNKAGSNIRQALMTLSSRQMASGAIALWPGASAPDLWVTSYAGHFAIEAERIGYSLSPSFRQKWITYQTRAARDWRFDKAFPETAVDQAYRLFTLALAGAPERGAMNRLRETSALPALSQWLLAAAFAAGGRSEIAEALVDVRATNILPEYSYYPNYGSILRDKAVVLYTLAAMKKTDAALPLLKDLSKSLSEDTWYSTQSIAWGLFAYMKFAEALPADSKSPAKLLLNINGSGSEVSLSSKDVYRKPISVKNTINNLEITHQSGQPVYVTLARKGIPLVSDQSYEEKGLSLQVSYVNTSLQKIDHTALEQGTDFMMLAKVTNLTFSAVSNIALTQMIPSGWEIRNTRLFEADYGIKESSWDHRDIRDDRVLTYFSLARGETKTFVIILNAAYKGTFNQPAVWCEAMYQENCYSRIPGTRVVVEGK